MAIIINILTTVIPLHICQVKARIVSSMQLESTSSSADTPQNVSCPVISWPALTELLSAVESHTTIIFQDDNSEMSNQFLEDLHSLSTPLLLSDCRSFLFDEKVKTFLNEEIRAQCYFRCIVIVQCNLTMSRRIIRSAMDFELIRPWILWIFVDPLARELLEDALLEGSGVNVAIPAVLQDSSFTTAKFASCEFNNALKLYSLTDNFTTVELGIVFENATGTYKNLFNNDRLYLRSPTSKSQFEVLDLLNGTIKVGAKLLTPFLESDSASNSTSAYRGVCKKILDAFATSMNFKYEIIRSESIGKKHRADSGDDWDGIIGDIISGKIDIAVGAITITEERADVVDFTHHFLEDTSSILSCRPQQRSRILIFYRVFPWQVWVLLLLSIVILGPTMTVLEKLSPSKTVVTHPAKLTIWKCWWSLSLSAIQKGEVAPCGIASRALAVFWLMFLVILIGTYSGVLLSVMSFPGYDTPFEVLTQFDNPSSPFPLALKGSATQFYIDEAETDAARAVKRRWDSNPTLILPTTPEDISSILLTGNYALLSERLIFQKLIASQRDVCNCCPYYESREDFLKHYYAFMVTKHSALLPSMNIILHRLTESGIIQHWLKETLPNIKQCQETKSTPDSIGTMELSDMQGAFYTLAIGLFFSIVALGAETIVTFTKCCEVATKNKPKKLKLQNKPLGSF